MKTLTHEFRLRHVATSLLLAVIWTMFAYRHIVAFGESGQPMYLVFTFSETLAAGFFVFRFAPVTVSKRPLDWVIAIGGTVAPLFFIPVPGGGAGEGEVLVVAGTVLQIFGLISLNRSFALVAAKRRIRTNGMYRVLRHPIYAAYLVLFSGYVWGNTTLWNAAIYCFLVGCVLARVMSEEKHLSLDAAYRNYMRQVQYRLIPFIY